VPFTVSSYQLLIARKSVNAPRCGGRGGGCDSSIVPDHERIQPFRYGVKLCRSLFRVAGFDIGPDSLMANANREIRRKEITELARRTWLRIWSE
jgi:hypothetical protein